MNSNHQRNPLTEDCIVACSQCHQSCLTTLMTHCLVRGGKHVEAEHLKLMINCAEICQTSVNFMLSNSPYTNIVCHACAEVCLACADSCEAIGDMEDCVKMCRKCAHHCHSMAAG